MLRRIAVNDRLVPRSRTRIGSSRFAALLLAAGTTACAGGPSMATRAAPEFSDASWQALVQARPQAAMDAPRISVTGVLLTADPWALSEAGSALALTELVVAGLLERTDVAFVERRRFVPAAERVRRGLPRPAGEPPVGTSPGAEWMLHVTVVTNPAVPGSLDMRLVHVQSGANRAGWRVEVPAGAELVGMARLITGSLLSKLQELDLAAAGATSDGAQGYMGSAVPPAATQAFLSGVRWGDLYGWDLARAAYESAISLAGGSFPEAAAALRREARLRSGSPLGGS